MSGRCSIKLDGRLTGNFVGKRGLLVIVEEEFQKLIDVMLLVCVFGFALLLK